MTPTRKRVSPMVVGTVVGGFIANALLTGDCIYGHEDPPSATVLALLGALWAAWSLLLVVSARHRFSIEVARLASTLGGLCVGVAFTSCFLSSW